MDSSTNSLSPLFTFAPSFTVTSMTLPGIGHSTMRPFAALAAWVGAAAAASSTISTIGAPTCTESPALTRMRRTVPSKSAVMSFSIFMDSSTNSLSPFFTLAPTFTVTSMTLPGIGHSTMRPFTESFATAAASSCAASLPPQAQAPEVFCFALYSASRFLRRKPVATFGKSSKSSMSFSSTAKCTPPNSSSTGLSGVLWVVVSYGVSTGDPVICSRNLGSTGTGVLPYSPFTKFTNWLEVLAYLSCPFFRLNAQDTACAPTIWLVGVTSGGRPASRRTLGMSFIASSSRSIELNCFNWATMLLYIPPGISAFFTSSFGFGKLKYFSMAWQASNSAASSSLRTASMALSNRASMSAGSVSVSGLNGFGNIFDASKASSSLRISFSSLLILATASMFTSSSTPSFLQKM